MIHFALQKLMSLKMMRGIVLVAFAMPTSPVLLSQELPPTQYDIPWRPDMAAGELKAAGQTRVLPQTESANSNLSDQPRPSVSTGQPAPAASRDANANPEPATAGDNAKWWNEEAEANIGDSSPQQNLRSVAPNGQIIKSSQIMGTVGSEPILAADMLGRINELLAPYAERATEEQLEEQRWMLMQRMMPSLIESKVVYLDFIRSMPPESLSQIRANVYQQFDEKQMPLLMEKAKLKSLAELDKRLRGLGSSLDSTRRAFFEQVTAREMIRRETAGDIEITHDELLDYYREHQAEFSFPSKARWEIVSSYFANAKSKADAYNKTAAMGNRILRGAPFAVIAKRESDALDRGADEVAEWTSQGSLVSEVIDNAIFTLPVNQMSRILKDEKGFHIVRVLAREEGGFTPFTEAQVGIREKIKEQKQDGRVKEYLERLKRDTYVWSYFEEQETQTANGSKALKR